MPEKPSKFDQLEWDAMRSELLYPKQNVASLRRMYAGLPFFAKLPKYKPSFSQAAEYPSSQRFAIDHRDFLRKLFEWKEHSLLQEWFSVLCKQGKTLPINTLPHALDYMSKQKGAAAKWWPALGEEGLWLSRHNPAWHFVQQSRWAQMLAHGTWPEKLYAWLAMTEIQMINPYRLLNEAMVQLKETELRRLIQRLPPATEGEEFELLEKWMHQAKASIQWSVAQKMLESITDTRSDIKGDFYRSLANDQLHQWQPPWWPSKKLKDPMVYRFLVLPAQWIQAEQADLFYGWLLKKDLLQKWTEKYYSNRQSKSALSFGMYLLRKNLLNENFPLNAFSDYLKFEDFNQLACRWIAEQGENTDVEALFKVVKYEKHFWSEELLSQLLNLRSSKAVSRKYDLEVFWKLIPYKMNPYQLDKGQIEKFLSHLPHDTLSFEEILRFRLWIRTKYYD